MVITRLPFASIILSGLILTLSACGGQPITFNANPASTSSVTSVSSEEASSEASDQSSDSSIVDSSSSISSAIASSSSTSSTVASSSSLSTGSSSSISSTIVTSSSSSLVSSSRSSSSSSRSSSSSSSVASSSSSLTGPTGAQLYVSKTCAACHAADGSGGIVSVSLRGCASCTSSLLANRITTTMPQGNIGSCDAACGTKIAQYILGGFVASSNQTTTLLLKQTAASETAPSNSLLENANSSCAIAYSANDLRPLTRKEYSSAIFQITGINLINDLGQNTYDALPLDNITTQLYNSVKITIDNNTQQAYNLVANKIAEQLYTNNFNGIANCNDSECYNQIIDNFGCKVFRRPLTTEERSNYLFFYNSNLKDGIKKVLGIMLASSNFIYRSDIGLSIINKVNGGYSENLDNVQSLIQTPKTIAIYEQDILNATFTGNDVVEITVKSTQSVSGLWPTMRVQVGNSTFVDLIANQADATTYRFHVTALTGNNSITITNQQTGAPLEYQAGHNLIISNIKLSSSN